MVYQIIREQDFDAFHLLAERYYREGEDADTPQEEIDSFIRLLFEKIVKQEIIACFAVDHSVYAGFALWAVDSEDFFFRELPGFGTILEIGFLPSFRGMGRGRDFVTFIEQDLRKKQVSQCYVCAYGPAQAFWTRCGYASSGKTAENGLPILIKSIV